MPAVVKRRFFSMSEKKALVLGYLQSPLGLQAYVSAQRIGLSSLTKWAKHFSISLRKDRKVCRAENGIGSQEPVKSASSQDIPLFVDLTASLQEQGFVFSGQKGADLKKALNSVNTTKPAEIGSLERAFPLSLKICFPKGITMSVEGLGEDQALRFVRSVL